MAYLLRRAKRAINVQKTRRCKRVNTRESRKQNAITHTTFRTRFYSTQRHNDPKNDCTATSSFRPPTSPTATTGANEIITCFESVHLWDTLHEALISKPGKKCTNLTTPQQEAQQREQWVGSQTHCRMSGLKLTRCAAGSSRERHSAFTYCVH